MDVLREYSDQVRCILLGSLSKFYISIEAKLPHSEDKNKNLNGLPYHEGSIPYSLLSNILDGVRHLTIYTYGSDAKKIFREPASRYCHKRCTGTWIPNAKDFTKLWLFKNHPARYCALAKGKAIKDFIENAIFYEYTLHHLGNDEDHSEDEYWGRYVTTEDDGSIKEVSG